MEVQEAIKTRRSVRKFTDEPVEAEGLETIIEAAARGHFCLEAGPLLGCVALGHAAYEPRAIKRKPGRYEIR